MVGQPDITDVHFQAGEPLTFKAEFEVVPEIELEEYQELAVPYHDPKVTDEDVNKRIEELRDQKAEYVNVDPRAGGEWRFRGAVPRKPGRRRRRPVKQDEMMLEMGGGGYPGGFTENLRGMHAGRGKGF